MKVAFIGHREILQRESLETKLSNLLEKLIINEEANMFLFGGRSEFNNLCYDVVTKLKAIYLNIRRVYIRAEHEHIDDFYYEYLSTYYEETFYPSNVHGAGRLSYIIRNQTLVDECDVLVVYYNDNYRPCNGTRSGTKIAVDYAKRKDKRIINLFEL